MLIRLGNLALVKFGADYHAAAVVFQSGGEVDCRYPERRAEFHDAFGRNRAGDGIEESTRIPGNGQQGILQHRRLLLRRGGIPDRFVAANLLNDGFIADIGQV